MSYWTREGCAQQLIRACALLSCTQPPIDQCDVIKSCTAAKLCSDVLAVYNEGKEFKALLKK